MQDHLEARGFDFSFGDFGEVEILTPLSEEQYEELNHALGIYGVELFNDQKNLLIRGIKNAIGEMLNIEEGMPAKKVSAYLSEKLNYSYGYLTAIFSEATFISISQFMMIQKVERVKDLIINSDLTLTEISYRLNYSSLAHLSNQFKKITGLSPKLFKDIVDKKRAMQNEG